jgi:hypothetical protein
MRFHFDRTPSNGHAMDQRFGREPYLPLDYVCAIHYLTPVVEGGPAFAIVPGGHQFATIEEARAGLGEAFCEQPIYGPAGTAVLYDIGIFHTRMDGFDLQARKTIAEPERTVGRRTVHQYFSRGGWLGTSRRPAPPLTDWNIQPQRLADNPDREERIFFGHWNTAMADWAHAGYPALLKIPGPNRPFKSDS